MLVPSRLDFPRNECPFGAKLQDVRNHLKILFVGPLVFIDSGVDMVEPSVSTALSGFEKPSFRLNEHLIADFFPLVLIEAIRGDCGQKVDLLRSPEHILSVKG